MSSIMSSISPSLTAFVADITFFEIMASLLVVGLIEQIVIRLPADMVGPGGWLLDTGSATDTRS